ncbi:hypothetical protein EVAR_80100_1 [Eumeta japonica]|uniref:Uncharacterized protein n=1 Tax=Eumeta variegata TaxID=151549 RepID=A0A4C1UDP9_EUMVA|nr:hypothetical protein EVAR_80100_1 [Eumeta japonica]
MLFHVFVISCGGSTSSMPTVRKRCVNNLPRRITGPIHQSKSRERGRQSISGDRRGRVLETVVSLGRAPEDRDGYGPPRVNQDFSSSLLDVTTRVSVERCSAIQQSSNGL